MDRLKLATAVIFGVVLALLIASRQTARGIVEEPVAAEEDLQQSSIAACMLAGHAVQFDEDARPISCKPKPFK